MTLLAETLHVMQSSGLKAKDIIFIGSEESGHACTWEEFQVLADKDYDSGYGAQEVASDLVIIFANGTKMYRSEYDGSEWWTVSPPFVMPTKQFPITDLFCGKKFCGWQSLKELHT